VDAKGICKLADFGVSSNLDKTLGKNRTVIGTPHWMAPEVLTNDDYNEKADIWSLGITAYELAIGEPPHSKLHSMRAAIKIPTSPPPTLPEPERFSADFHSFLAACLVKDFEARPSATSLLSHPFILRAPSESILMDNVRAAMQELESRHESIDEINGLMAGGLSVRPPSHHGTGDKKSLRGPGSRSQNQPTPDALLHSPSSNAGIDDDFDDFFDNETDFGASDTMVPTGGSGVSDTMVPSGAAAAALSATSATMVPLDATVILNNSVATGARHAPSDTIVFGTIVPNAAVARAAPAPVVAAPVASAAPAAAAAVSTPAEEDAILNQFADDSDDDELPELRITEEHD